MAELVHCALSCEAKAFNEEARTVEVVMSTDRIDRHGERVEQTWQLENFKRTPSVLWAHDSRSLPVGRAENVRIENGALVGTIRFASAAGNPLAEQCVQLFREGMLNSCSVGFIPHTVRFEKLNGEELVVLSDNELVELSLTPTPANPDAVARRRAKALELRAATTAPTTQPLPSPASPGPNPDAERKAPSMELKDAIAKIETLTASNTKLEVEGKSAAERITAAEKRAEVAEKSAADATAEVKTLAVEKAAFETQTKALVERAEKAEKVVAELEAKTVDQEVEALVGKKISAAEKPLFVDLCKTNKDLFTKMIEQRSPMDLEKEITKDGKSNGAAPSAGDTSDLAAEFRSAAV